MFKNTLTMIEIQTKYYPYIYIHVNVWSKNHGTYIRFPKSSLHEGFLKKICEKNIHF